MNPYSPPSPCAAARAFGNAHRCEVFAIAAEMAEAIEAHLQHDGAPDSFDARSIRDTMHTALTRYRSAADAEG